MKIIAVILMVSAMFITLAILVVGIFGMARGGPFNDKWSNKLMRARIFFQLIALAMFALAVMIFQS